VLLSIVKVFFIPFPDPLTTASAVSFAVFFAALSITAACFFKKE
jgi:hypothetical protein